QLRFVPARARRQVPELHAGGHLAPSGRRLFGADARHRGGRRPLRRKSDFSRHGILVRCRCATHRSPADSMPAHRSLTRRIVMPRLLLACLLALVSSAASAALNLNTATKEDLVALQGIGPSKAQAILDYRAAHGGFKTIDELKDVKGIGAKRFEKLKAELTVTPLAARAAPARSPDAKGAVTKGEIKAAGDAKHK